MNDSVHLISRTTGSGAPIYILHGLLGSGDNWQSITKRFADQYTVHVVDLRNHGHSPHTEEMSFDLMAADLFELVARNGDRDLNIIGHSMGGKTAMRFSQLYGMLVHKLVVADIGIKKYNPHHDHIFRALLSADLASKKSRREVEHHLASHGLDAANVQFLMKSLYWKEPGSLAWRFNVPVLEKSTVKLLTAIEGEKIETETLFIRGENSHYIEPSDEYEIRKQVPHAEFITIPGAGHWVHADAPALFAETVLQFISR